MRGEKCMGIKERTKDCMDNSFYTDNPAHRFAELDP